MKNKTKVLEKEYEALSSELDALFDMRSNIYGFLKNRGVSQVICDEAHEFVVLEALKVTSAVHAHLGSKIFPRLTKLQELFDGFFEAIEPTIGEMERWTED